MLILKDEHAIDVLKSGNTGHLWHDFHAIDVHATDVGDPEDDDDDEDDEVEKHTSSAAAGREGRLGQAPPLSDSAPAGWGRRSALCFSFRICHNFYLYLSSWQDFMFSDDFSDFHS